jgi:hypothetical protein
LIFVRVDLGQDEAAGELIRQLLQDGSEHAAGPAPGRPEIHHDWGLLRPLQDVCLESGIRYFDHKL